MPVLRAAWAAWICKVPRAGRRPAPFGPEPIVRGASVELGAPRAVYQLDSYGRSARASARSAGKSRSKTP